MRKPRRRSVWDFDSVANTFESHARDSIPFYDEIQSLVVSAAEHLLPLSQPGGEPRIVMDIGCSSGNLLSSFAEHLGHLNLRLVGVDSSQPMIDFARRNYSSGGLTFSCENVEKIDFEGVDLVVANFVLQFLSPKSREELLHKIFAALPLGGCLIVFEKHHLPTSQMESIANDTYLDWKADRGFDDLSIREKTRQLRGVMSLVEVEFARAQLRDSGFSQIHEIFQWLGFSGRIAIK